jgi:tetratricopeptide (TPR) repeat protein
MGGRYGMSFAKSLIERGDYEEAIAEATREIESGGGGPEPWVDRATANELAEKWGDAVRDFEQAIAINREAKELDPFALDDAYFSALLSLARDEAIRSTDAATKLLARYRDVVPDGAHTRDVEQWAKRLRGELPSLLDKTVDV